MCGECTQKMRKEENKWQTARESKEKMIWCEKGAGLVRSETRERAGEKTAATIVVIEFIALP